MKILSFFTVAVFSFIMMTGCSMTDSPDTAGVYKVKKEYFTGGQIRSEFLMSDESGQNGVMKQYGYDGHVTSMGRIKNGVNDGVEKWFDKQGRMIMKVMYVNGKKHGIQEAYYPNGDVMMSTTYVNSVKSGEAITYNQDGSINKQVIFKNNEIVN